MKQTLLCTNVQLYNVRRHLQVHVTNTFWGYVSYCCLMSNEQISAISRQEHVTFNEMIMMWIFFDFYNASSLKQQSVRRHVSPIRHITYPHSEPTSFVLSLYCCMLSEEATNNNFIV